MNCLKGHIGINGTCDDANTGLSYNSLEGVDFVALESLTTEERELWTEVFSDLEDNAIRALLDDAGAVFHRKFNTTYPTQSGKVGAKRPITPLVLDDFGVGNLAGFLFDPIDAEYLKISINSLLIHATGPATFTLYFGDAESGEVWDSKELEAVTGLNKFALNFSQSIGDDCRPFLYWKTDEFNTVAQAQTFHKDTTGIESVRFGKTVGTDPLDAIDTIINEKPAAQLCYSIGCSADAWICKNASRFTRALLFGFGLKLLIERISSQRCNRFTLVPENEVETLTEYYNQGYKTAIDNAFADAHTPKCSICFKCEGAYHYQHIIP